MNFNINNYKLIFFDFDGVIVDTEWLHFLAFNEVLKNYNIGISKEEYLAKYLAFDDKGCFKKVFEEKLNKKLSLDDINILIKKKNKILMSHIAKKIDYYPDAIEFINYVSKNFKDIKMAIVSGALRSEIVYILKKLKIYNKFFLIVSSGDVKNGKPSAEPFILAKKLSEQKLKKTIFEKEILVIEDSINGIKAGLKAGFDVLAVAHTYNLKELYKTKANFVVKSLNELIL